MLDGITASWGYWAIFTGVMLEGEVVYLGGILGTQIGKLHLPMVFMLSFLAAVMRDGAIFLLSRNGSERFLPQKSGVKEKMSSIGEWIEEKPGYLLMFYRFFYGTSTLIIISMSLSSMSRMRYLGILISGALLWAIVYGTIGSFAAAEIIARFEWIKDHSGFLIGGLLITGIIYFLIRRFRS
jgi:membrane protein DedA with SNARE-associated domain